MREWQRIARIRIDKGWTQEKLALATGLSRGYISAIERGKAQPKLKTLSIIAQSLGVEIEKLYEDLE
ncbi:MAG: helix-turn-helix transcriptional regulator [Carboxydocellales bacterium]